MKSASHNVETLLSDCRGLELTDDRGQICGEILSELGAEIIKVEPPGGEPSRRIGPYFHDEVDPLKSLYWAAHNRDKKSITLDIEMADGQELFKGLAKRVDLIIESFPPGQLGRLGLGYEVLHNVNPKLVMTSITPFGQTGPYSDYKASDLVIMALAGRLFIEGDPSTPPVNVSLPQGYLMAGAQAAVATMTAYYHSKMHGQGQYVDVSAQQSAALYLANIIPLYELEGVIIKRAGVFRVGLSGGISQRQIWRCKDGFVAFIITGGRLGRESRCALINWIKDEGMADETLLAVDWVQLDMSEMTQELEDQIERAIGKFFLTKTKAELYERALKEDMWLFPMSTPEDLLRDPQLSARDYWIDINHPELGTSIKFPGSFFKSSITRGAGRRRAPLPGEHNDEIYRRMLGFDTEDMASLKEAGVI
ncbi:MAG: CoA transferase [Deltaproteobacteria bacterium]|nr:MAG: CoA transferase [Deltaproteobacteria bacterium]